MWHEAQIPQMLHPRTRAVGQKRSQQTPCNVLSDQTRGLVFANQLRKSVYSTRKCSKRR